MNSILILVMALALFQVSNAGAINAELRSWIIDFYKCVSCHSDPASHEDYTRCFALKSDKGKKMIDDCHDEIIPGFEEQAGRWVVACKNERNQIERMVDCLSEHDANNVMTDEDKTHDLEFLTCIMGMNEKYCSH